MRFISGPHRTVEVVAAQRGAYLDLDEDAHQVGAAGARAPEIGQLHVEIEAGLLALAEASDGLLHARGIQPQLRHHRARGRDLLLGDAAVGLGEVAHDPERGAEEALADRRQLLRTGGGNASCLSRCSST